MTQKLETKSEGTPTEANNYDTRSGCLGLSVVLFICVGAAVLACVLLGNWKK